VRAVQKEKEDKFKCSEYLFLCRWPEIFAGRAGCRLGRLFPRFDRIRKPFLFVYFVILYDTD
jgi:hypothetical protein